MATEEDGEEKGGTSIGANESIVIEGSSGNINVAKGGEGGKGGDATAKAELNIRIDVNSPWGTYPEEVENEGRQTGTKLQPMAIPVDLKTIMEIINAIIEKGEIGDEERSLIRRLIRSVIEYFYETKDKNALDFAGYLHEKLLGGSRRVVFVDLDYTLMDSFAAWCATAKNGIKELGLQLTEDQALALARAVYNNHPHFSREPFGYADFRQVWYDRDFFATLLALDTEEIRSIFEGIQKPLEDETFMARLTEYISNLNAKELKQKIEDIKNDPRNRVKIEGAHAEARSTDFKSYAYEGAGRLFELLSGLGIDYYIVTEGDWEAQAWKIKQIGIGIPDSRVIATSRAAYPVVDINRLRCAVQQIDEQIRECDEISRDYESDKRRYREFIKFAEPEEREVIRGVRKRYCENFRKRIGEAKKKRSQLENSKKLLSDFINLFGEFSEERMVSYYALVTMAISANPANPNEFFRVSRKAVNVQGLKVARVGDRQDIDVNMWRRFDPNAIAVRVMQGRYAKSLTQQECQAPEYREATKVVDSIREAAIFLADPMTWYEAKPIGQPTVIDPHLTDEQLFELRRALASENPLVRDAAYNLVQALIETTTDESKKKQLSEIIQPTTGKNTGGVGVINGATDGVLSDWRAGPLGRRNNREVPKGRGQRNPSKTPPMRH
ncbi:MAG: hypothetical protein QXP42_05235 [Candidatus Micrarchaeia archaeon]